MCVPSTCYPEREAGAQRDEITSFEVTQGVTARGGVGIQVSDDSLEFAERVAWHLEGLSEPPLFPQETGMLP